MDINKLAESKRQKCQEWHKKKVDDDNEKNIKHLNSSAHKTTRQLHTFSWSSSTPYFNGKEKDRESGFHYYGARYHWSEVMTGWLSVDPMADKYPNISPYNYCMWNPVKLIDPDGCIVVPAENSTPQFVEYINQAKLLLCQKGAANILYQLEVLPIIIKIQEITYAEAEAGRITHKSGVISWCPTADLTTTENVVISPTTILNHEFDHALQDILNPKQKAQDKATEDYNYDNAEERRVITGSEQETAIKLGEILPGQITRDNHLGKTIPVESTTSTDVKIPFRTSPCGTVIDEITVN